MLHVEDILQRKLHKRNTVASSSAEDALNLSYAEAKESFEKAFLLRILSAAKGSIAEAARISGRYRSDIYRLLERYKINIDDFKS